MGEIGTGVFIQTFISTTLKVMVRLLNLENRGQAYYFLYFFFGKKVYTRKPSQPPGTLHSTGGHSFSPEVHVKQVGSSIGQLLYWSRCHSSHLNCRKSSTRNQKSPGKVQHKQPCQPQLKWSGLFHGKFLLYKRQAVKKGINQKIIIFEVVVPIPAIVQSCAEAT